jgi:hypothetical protein
MIFISLLPFLCFVQSASLLSLRNSYYCVAYKSYDDEFECKMDFDENASSKEWGLCGSFCAYPKNNCDYFLDKISSIFSEANRQLKKGSLREALGVSGAFVALVDGAWMTNGCVDKVFKMNKFSNYTEAQSNNFCVDQKRCPDGYDVCSEFDVNYPDRPRSFKLCGHNTGCSVVKKSFENLFDNVEFAFDKNYVKNGPKNEVGMAQYNALGNLFMFYVEQLEGCRY